MEQQTVAIVQGGYFLLTGLWPLFSIGTFQKVTGPKRDLWLVKTVGVVLAVIGAALLVAGIYRESGHALHLLALGSAAVLTGVDLNYVARRVIAPVYLLDAAAELCLMVCWFLVLV